MTKKLINDAGGYKTFVELRQLDSAGKEVYFRISSTYDRSSDPTFERTQFETCLDSAALSALKSIFNEV